MQFSLFKTLKDVTYVMAETYNQFYVISVWLVIVSKQSHW